MVYTAAEAETKSMEAERILILGKDFMSCCCAVPCLFELLLYLLLLLLLFDTLLAFPRAMQIEHHSGELLA